MALAGIVKEAPRGCAEQAEDFESSLEVWNPCQRLTC